MALTLWAAPAFPNEAAPPDLGGEGLGAAFGQMLMALGLVLALVVGLYVLAKRFLPAGAGAGAVGGLRLMGRLPLGPRKWLALVQAGDKALLLGVSDQSINLLTTLDDPALVGQAAKAGPAFARLLKRAQTKPEEPQP